MKFRLYRTTCWDDASPHDKAYSELHMRVDHRKFTSPEEHDAAMHSSWLSYGTNHRLINGTIARDVGMQTCWFIDINNLEELLAFQKECGCELVIEGSTLEIYDDYRE